jgi:hypothetical protein
LSFSKEARDLLIECCVEFITLVSSEANEISEKEAKKTIACDHITKALDTLGFGDYVAAVLEAAAAHKETQKVIKNIVSTFYFPILYRAAALTGRLSNREPTSSRIAACLWRSWNDCKPSNLRRLRRDTTERCRLKQSEFTGFIRRGHGMA